ncbi:MAG TPA: hypothetical protein PKY35_01150 [Candidatus Hydrogenedentes bacterium]|nr:hypothetical protein [Candidatus Hydrogenedentota bacterium]HOL75608.1 hypothetical protein [Candidatus Hydrogenedentota bacterium]HPO84399.1 hypothetical protein [Candidatus Hydrogenedentota bacterium]
MNIYREHCKPISKRPVAAQSTLNLKIDFATHLMDYALRVQHSKPWGIIWPPNFTGSTGSGGTDTGTGTVDTTGGTTGTTTGL